jgi:hypothetical protein
MDVPGGGRIAACSIRPGAFVRSTRCRGRAAPAAKPKAKPTGQGEAKAKAAAKPAAKKPVVKKAAPKKKAAKKSAPKRKAPARKAKSRPKAQSQGKGHADEGQGKDRSQEEEVKGRREVIPGGLAAMTAGPALADFVSEKKSKDKGRAGPAARAAS